MDRLVLVDQYDQCDQLGLFPMVLSYQFDPLNLYNLCDP